MYFNRMKEYYETQSSGRYSIEGDVTEWVKVPYNQALYGRGYCGTPLGAAVTSCASTKALVRDAMAVWVDNQLKSGQTMAQIQAYLKTFDEQDRYDVDGDGNYDEPDGFIDHFQIVHAGGDEAANDPIYGSDAIWSHRWYSNLQAGGPGGQTGVNIGSNGGAFGLGSSAANPVPNNPTGVWVGDYTIQPENGGLGVFAHEYAHDLGLPDLYDTSGNTGGGENSTAFWTLMSSGSNIGDGGETTGDAPVDMGVWELLQLGWLDEQAGNGPFYDLVQPGERKEVRLGKNVPASTGGAQALITRLPDLTRDRVLGKPYAGQQMFWSGEGNNLRTTMTKTGVTGTSFTAKVDYVIETDWDYAYLEASTDGGTTWKIVPTNRSTNTNPNTQNEGNGITGTSGGWVDLSATLPTGTNAVRLRYWTDVAAVERGLFVDDIAIDGKPIGTAETDEGWVLDGFKRTTGTEVEKFFNAYIAENRQYDGYDTSLKTAYNFGWLQTQPDKVQLFPYQNGVLINYWNEMYADNNVSTHPGAGQILPIDAHPELTHWSDGTLLRPRFLSYDSTFGREATDAISLQEEYLVDGKVQTRTGTVAAKPATPVFDDRKTWWYGSDEHGGATHPGRYKPGWYSVNPPKTGTTMRVEDFQGNGTVKVRVNW
jgi:immune inhibitor A